MVTLGRLLTETLVESKYTIQITGKKSTILDLTLIAEEISHILELSVETLS